MLTFLNGKSHRRLTVLKFIIPVAACLLAGIYLATNLMGLSAQSEPEAPSPPDGFFTTTTQYTNYNFYPDISVHDATKQAYMDHMDTQFKLFMKEEGGRLHISVNVPTMHYPAGINRSSYKYSLMPVSKTAGWETITYGTVGNPADCNGNFFHNRRVVEEPATETSWPLSAADYGRYYCVKVRLKVVKPSYDFHPFRVFVADSAIAADGLNTHLSDLPGFSRTMIQDTVYGNTTLLDFLDPHLPLRQIGYQDHLNEHFHLFSQQTNNSFNLRLNLPGGFAFNGSKDINSFEIQYVEYTTVHQKNDCNRELFETGDINSYDEPTSEMSLTPASSDYGLHYCFKVGLKGERSLSADIHPNRIFYVPEIITASEPDDVWIYF